MIGLSNAAVAAMLGAPVVIVSEGGVGRPIDEIVLNASLFAAHGVPVAGAIVNKVELDAQPGIVRTLERGLAHHGIPLLGVLPYRPILSNPTLGMVLEGVHGEPLHAGPDLDAVIGDVAIGAMEPGHMLERVGPRTLVIVPGDREDVILTLTTAHLVGPAAAARGRHVGPERRERAAGGLEGRTVGRRRRGRRARRRGARARPDRRLPAAAGGHRRDPPGRPVRDPRPRRHVHGRLGGPRPPGQDAPGRPREDRAHQGRSSPSTSTSTGSSRRRPAG